MTPLVTGVLITVVILLLILSAFFSASETSYTGLNRTRLKSMDPDGTDRRIARTLQNYEQFDRLLTTILVGNNIVNIASSTICTTLLCEYLGETWGTVAATLLMITVLLIVGEITPKTIAKRNPEKVAIWLSGAIAFSMRALKYITSVFMKVTQGVSHVTGGDEEPDGITEEELSVMIDEIQQEGTLEKNESELIKSAMEFDDTRVGDICIPRVDIVSVNITEDLEKVKAKFIDTELSRIPVYEGSIDRIIGAVFFKDFFSKYTTRNSFSLADVIRPVKFEPKDAKLDSVMNDLQKSKLHMAIVLDEYGGTYGLVTMEDILEELVGEIYDESDEIKRAYVRESDTQYMVYGDANIMDVTTMMGLNFDPEDYESGTVGGYIAYRLEKVPTVGDTVECPDFTITVRSVRSRRVRETTFTLHPQTDGESQEE